MNAELAAYADSQAAVFDRLCEVGRIAPLLVASLWSGGMHPYLTQDQWIEVWRQCGYADYLPDERRAAARPAAPLVLYRGAPATHAHGLSWTTSAEHAGLYADAKIDGVVWCAWVHPAHLLASLAAEAEYVVDPRGLSANNVWQHGTVPPPLVRAERPDLS